MEMEELNSSLSEIAGTKLTWIDNSVLMLMGDGTEIFLEYLREYDEIFMYGYVAEVSEDRFGKFAVSLLKANLFGQDTGGSAVLAYDSDEGRVVLWDKLPLSKTDMKELQERLSYLYLSVLHWAGKLRRDLITGDLNDIGVMSATITG